MITQVVIGQDHSEKPLFAQDEISVFFKGRRAREKNCPRGAGRVPAKYPLFHPAKRPAGIDCLQSIGVERIVDLEAARFWKIIPERRYAQSIGMEFIRVPMYAFPFFFSRLPHVQDSQINKILDLLDEGKEHPVFVHCLKGNDRTGLVIGLHRVVNEGMAPGLAWEEMLQFDFHTRFRALTRYFESRTGFDVNEDSPDGSAQDSTLKNENE